MIPNDTNGPQAQFRHINMGLH